MPLQTHFYIRLSPSALAVAELTLPFRIPFTGRVISRFEVPEPFTFKRHEIDLLRQITSEADKRRMNLLVEGIPGQQGWPKLERNLAINLLLLENFRQTNLGFIRQFTKR